jgi:hypothetical protein
MPPEQNGPSRAGGSTEAKLKFSNSKCSRQVTPNQERSQGAYFRTDFAKINRAALARLPDVLARWLPGGRIEGREYVVRNPKRHDRRLGSFKVNLVTARWSDFATGDRGGDPISLLAYLSGLSQFAAAKQLASMLSVEGRRGR